MSEHVDRLGEMVEAFNRRDFDTALRYTHPDVELHPGLTELDVATEYRGRDEFKRFMETITGAWESYVVHFEETIEAADDRVLTIERWRAQGRQGIQFDFQLFDVYTFRDGLVARIDGFRDRAEALAALEGDRAQ